MDIEAFKSASAIAELWLDVLFRIAKSACAKDYDEAYKLLAETAGSHDDSGLSLNESYLRHAWYIVEATDGLAAISDSPVRWEWGRGKSAISDDPSSVLPHVWSSAHEMAECLVRMALEEFLWPVDQSLEGTQLREAYAARIQYRWIAIKMDADEVAILKERIRRERAKFVVRLTSQSTTGQDDRSPRQTNVIHSDDFRTLNWYGVEYDFTPMQAACIKVLYGAFNSRTPVLSQDLVIAEVESCSDRLRDIFKGHEAWGTLIVSPRRGCYMLKSPG